MSAKDAKPREMMVINEKLYEESISFPAIDDTDYKSLYEERERDNIRLRERITRLQSKLREKDNDPRFEVNVSQTTHNFDYRIQIDISSYLLRQMYRGGYEDAYLLPIARDITHKCMKQLHDVLSG